MDISALCMGLFPRCKTRAAIGVSAAAILSLRIAAFGFRACDRNVGPTGATCRLLPSSALLGIRDVNIVFPGHVSTSCRTVTRLCTAPAIARSAFKESASLEHSLMIPLYSNVISGPLQLLRIIPLKPRKACASLKPASLAKLVFLLVWHDC